MKFRRNTHTREGVYRKELNVRGQFPTLEQHGDIVHALDSRKGMSLFEVCEGIQRDTTNYRLPGQFVEGIDDRSPLPTPGDIAFGLVRLIEDGLVEVVSE